jgi:hypothetical protein
MFNIGNMIDAPLESVGLDLQRLPFVGGIFPGDEEKQQRERFEAVANRYRQLKPEVAQSRSQSLGTQLGALGPSNAMMGAMAGPGAMLNMQQLGQSPLTPGMVNTPQTQGSGSGGSGIGGLGGLAGALGPMGALTAGPIGAIGGLLGL